jgi:C-terminal processing protease CtpA/Prc
MYSGKNLYQIFLLIIICLGIFTYIGWYIGSNRIFSNQKDLSAYDVMYTYDLISENYYKKLDAKYIAQETISSMIRSLNDPNSYYLSREEYEKYSSYVEDTDSVSVTSIGDNFVDIKITHFSEKTDDEFKDLIDKKTFERIEKINIDLKDNLGGNFESALYQADLFVENGILAKEIISEKTYIHDAKAGDVFENIEVIIEVNKETSSAAELFLAALKENNRAKVVGETTYGKSTIGNFYGLSDGSAIHLTIGKWYTPNGNDVEGVGVLVE